MRDVTHGQDVSGREPSQARASFAAELMQLKREGCCVLVTGRVNESVRAAQSRQLFGAVDASRQRVLTLTDATSTGVSQYLPDGISPNHTSVTMLDYTETVRDATETASTPLSPPDMDTVETGVTLGPTLREPMSTVVQNTSTGPGELRLGVATLGTLIAIDGRLATQAFVCAVRTDVVSVHGIAHFHLPGTPDPETLKLLRPEMDIHIELRESHCVPEHRWHLLGSDFSTDWIPV